MAIIDGLNDQRGIQTLVTQIAGASTESQHMSDILHHDNGYLYVVVSQAFSNNAAQRRLYFYRSTDGGNSWTLITNLTTGGYDVFPTLLQLVPGNAASDIGILHIRLTSALNTGGVIRRMAVDVDGSVTTANDPITGSPSADYGAYCVALAGGNFKIFTSNGRFSNSAITYTNTSFSLNTWVAAGGVTILGVSNQGHLRRVRRLSNGDLLGVVAYRTQLSGGTAGKNGLPDNLRTDVGIIISTNDGATWASVQNLTNYSGTSGVSADGIKSALWADAVELSDGRIAVIYQEGYSYVAITGSTTPAISVAAGNQGQGYTKTILHPVHGYLMYAHGNGTSGGLFVHNLGTNTVTRIHTSSSPSIWENEITDMDISSDGKYLALTTYDSLNVSGSVEILDTTDPDPTMWTGTSLRTATSPALKAIGAFAIKFNTSGYDCYFAYSAVAGSGIWGGKLDASNIAGGITDLIAPGAVGTNVVVPGFAVGSTYLYSAASGTTRVFATNKTTGLGSHSSSIADVSVGTASKYGIFPLGSNIAIASSTTFVVVNDTGSAFTQVGSSITSTSNPAINGNQQRSNNLSSQNIILSGGSNEGFRFYCAASGVYYPAFAIPADAVFGFNFSAGNTMEPDESTINTKKWISLPDTDQHIRVHTETGRLRIGIFSYSAGTIGAGDFYDAVNQIRVGDDWNKLCWPCITRDAADKLVVSMTRLHFNRASQPKKVVVGIIESDAQKFQMRACILNTTTRDLLMRARIRNSYTAELDMRARIVFAQCIKMGARIVPRVTQSLEMRGCIQGSKSSSIVGTFNVSAVRQSQMLGTFVAATGYNTSQSLQMRASIVKQRKAQMTGHYIVKAGPNTSLIAPYTAGFTVQTVQTFRMGAGIVQQ